MRKPRTGLEFNQEDNGRVIEAGFGQTVELRLPENPTAGFRWRLVQAGDPVCAVLSDVFEPGGKTPGQSGFHRWRFKIVSPGAGTIELAYHRPWESDTAAEHNFSLSVKGKK